MTNVDSADIDARYKPVLKYLRKLAETPRSETGN